MMTLERESEARVVVPGVRWIVGPEPDDDVLPFAPSLRGAAVNRGVGIGEQARVRADQVTVPRGPRRATNAPVAASTAAIATAKGSVSRRRIGILLIYPPSARRR